MPPPPPCFCIWMATDPTGRFLRPNINSILVTRHRCHQPEAGGKPPVSRWVLGELNDWKDILSYFDVVLFATTKICTNMYISYMYYKYRAVYNCILCIISVGIPATIQVAKQNDPLLRWVGEGPYNSSRQKPLTISKNVVGKPQIWRVPNFETYLFPLTSSISSNAAKKCQNFIYLSNCPRIEGLRSLPWSKRYFEEKQYTLNERNGSFCQSMPQWVLGMVDAIYLPSLRNRPSNILIQLANLNSSNI